MKNFKRVNENYHMFICSFVSRWFGKTFTPKESTNTTSTSAFAGAAASMSEFSFNFGAASTPRKTTLSLTGTAATQPADHTATAPSTAKTDETKPETQNFLSH